MRVFAFEGLRYGAKAGDAGRLAAPPYDQIDDAARDRFQAASPYQFVHLTRPVATGSPVAAATPAMALAGLAELAELAENTAMDAAPPAAAAAVPSGPAAQTGGRGPA